MYASGRDRTETVQALLWAGADLNLRDVVPDCTDSVQFHDRVLTLYCSDGYSVTTLRQTTLRQKKSGTSSRTTVS
jgi:hypothetical protein